MTLDLQIRAELERRGPASVRALLSDSRYVGPGKGASVLLQVRDKHDPSRSEVEDWLREQDDAAERREAERYSQLLRWARIAGVAAIVGAIAAMAGVALTLVAMAH